MSIWFPDPGQVKRENEHWQMWVQRSQHVVETEDQKIIKSRSKVLREEQS